MNSGIYQIRNIINDKIYIGSAISLSKRKTNHFSDLKLQRHANIHLQRSFNKHGVDNFKFEILFTCPTEDLIRLEQYHINNYSPEYNICKIAGNSLGVKRSEKTLEKQRRRKHSVESKQRMSDSAKGRIVSEETRRKMSITKTGKPKSFDHVQKVKLGSMKAIVQINKIDGLIIRIFNSITEATLNLNISGSGISACAKNKRKTAGGFIWKFKNEIQCQ